ncbi:MAG: type I-C CRISPR-associated protein Cas7/Csd2 [Deltaproteobacteria bacterium HGW-Deltaproteobacteria-12]|jgi:CRISPR-associated protein Csd2|nr:MAG: type I-C CRISPR-associated protein Cas7/Csd2 [Deltaproteobacteria bacterium HGW-Deltaproteobacteria-12]
MNEDISKKTIASRVDFVLVFSVDNANPNGDPGYDNRPRMDDHTGKGFMTDVCLKRKIRNRIEMMKELKDGYDIWVRSGTYLRKTVENAIEIIRKEKEYEKLKTDKEKADYEKRRLCEQFFDIRAFGGVLTFDSESAGEEGQVKTTTKTKSKVSQIRGPVSIQYAKSVAPIIVEDDEITRVCPTQFDKNKPEKQTEMGRKKRVPFAVYVAKGSVSARLAEGEKGTGFSNADLQLLKDALKTLFLNDESTARPIGSMIMQKGIFFTNTAKDGDEAVHKTLERLKVEFVGKEENGFKVERPEKARDMGCYKISLDKENLPKDDNGQPKIKIEEFGDYAAVNI